MWYPLGILFGVLVLAAVKASGRRVVDVNVTTGPGRVVRPDESRDTEAESEADQKETEQFVQQELDKATVKALPAILPTPSFLSSSKVDANGKKIDTPSPRWTRYVQSVKTGGLGTITPNFNLGVFGLNMRTLEDFGYAKNVRKTNYNGRQVWRGDFIGAADSLEKFLSDGTVQYEVFLKMTNRHYAYITSKKNLVLYDDSKQIEGVTPTYSGLLAVAKFAGLSGLDKWLAGDRKPATTEAFKKSNGIF